MNPNPHQARQARRVTRRKPGSLEAARRLLWQALERAAELLGEEDPALSLKAVHAISQGTSAYAKIIEVGEFEARLAAIEAAQTAPGPRLGKVGT